MAETMVERAAKAHYERLHYTAWENLTPSTRAGFIGAMRAAIEALREPTEAMKAAGADGPTTLSYGDEDSFYYISEDDARSCWQSMIDAILKEEGNG